MLVAKVVADKQFWILQEDDRKVGNIEAWNGGYQVRINNQVKQFKTIKLAARESNIVFAKEETASKPDNTVVHGYPVAGRCYNPVWDVVHHLPIYTKTAKSKSWFAAGWYRVRKGKTWRAVLCPKLIVIQRYPYQGPFHSEEQVNDHALTEIC
jgi:hypothetical protein